MVKTGQSYSSGEWLVQAGSEEDFIERWNTFIEWSVNNAPGAESFVLVRSTENPRMRGERCPRCKSCSANAGSCARSSRPTHTPWRPA